MKPLEIKYKDVDVVSGTHMSGLNGTITPGYSNGCIVTRQVDVEATLQAIIDRVNELSGMGSEEWSDKAMANLKKLSDLSSGKRFKAEDIQTEEVHGMTRLSVYCSKTEAQAALEALLNL